MKLGTRDNSAHARHILDIYFFQWILIWFALSVTKYACIKVKIPVSIAALYRVDMFPVTDYKTCTQKLNKKSKAALGSQ